jgi:hypothetical protein
MVNICLLLVVFAEVVDYSKVIEVSKETTVITEPLAEDGLPDYEAYVLKKGFEGVTPENNAAVLLWEVLWPEGVEERYRDGMRAALKLSPHIDETPKLIRPNDESLRQKVSEWLVNSYSAHLQDPSRKDEVAAVLQDNPYLVQDIIESTRSRVWTSKDLPILAEWIADNEKQFELIVEASRRLKYYSPPPNFISLEEAGLLQALLPLDQNMRHVARSLATRSMWHIGEGRAWQAWDDMLACYRLANLIGDGSCLMQRMVAFAVAGVADNVTIAALHHGSLTQEQCRKVLLSLQSMPPFPSMVNAFDHFERLSYADAVLAMATGRNNAMTTKGEDIVDRVDWNVALREGNEFFDRTVSAERIFKRIERVKAFKEIEQEIASRSSEAKSFSSGIAGMFSHAQRSKTMSSIMLSGIFPSLRQALVAEERGTTLRRLTVMAAALAVFRAEHSSYPETLQELSPDILSKLPVDLYSDRPFIYRRKEEGYLLYSVYENGEDDNGTDFGGEIVDGEWAGEIQDIDPDKADLVIRMPLPPFKIPELVFDE